MDRNVGNDAPEIQQSACPALVAVVPGFERYKLWAREFPKIWGFSFWGS